jgi:hypothetical protein
LKSAITEMKNELKKSTSRFEQAEERISGLKDRELRLSSLREGKKKK